MTDILGRVLFYTFIIVGVPYFILCIVLNKTEDNIQAYIEKATTTFVDESRQCGFISPENLQLYSDRLARTGYLFEVEITHRSYIAYPADTSEKMSSHYMTYVKDEILDYMYPSSAAPKDYLMKNGDFLVVNIKSAHATMGTKMIAAFIKKDSDSLNHLQFSYSGMVGNSKN